MASRIQMQSDLWRFPVSGPPIENTRGGVRITHQTGQVQTPSLSPDGTELVYLSDSGGHGNLWVAKTDGSGVRQVTFQRDPAVTVGVSVWSSTRSLITFILADRRSSAQWLVGSDGSGLREFVRGGVWAHWSGDGRWLYYVIRRDSGYCIEKAPVDGGSPVTVRCDNACAPAIARDGSALYYFTPLKGESGGWDWEARVARPEGGQSRALVRIAASRVPTDPINLQGLLSPDGRWLALPLTDAATSNLWLISTEDGRLHPATDFGDRATIIARRVSWSPDGMSIYAAVAETDADVVLMDGLLR